MSNLLNKTHLFLKRNSSSILTGIGAAGVVVTSIMAVKATPKAIRILEKEKKEIENLILYIKKAIKKELSKKNFEMVLELISNAAIILYNTNI